MQNNTNIMQINLASAFHLSAVCIHGLKIPAGKYCEYQLPSSLIDDASGAPYGMSKALIQMAKHLAWNSHRMVFALTRSRVVYRNRHGANHAGRARN